MQPKNAYSLVTDEIPRLKRYAMFLTRDSERSEDLIQDTLVRAMTHIEKWQPGTNMRSWLMTILHNTFINDVKRHRPLLTRDGNCDYSRVVDGNQELAHQLRDVQRAFDHLSSHHREIIWMICVEQRGYSEVAAALNIPVGTVRSRLCRAREHIRQWASIGSPQEKEGVSPSLH
ncbi:MAG TPA: sigma-70 family RNA polymerase sigma factor [Dongiaceae bacterium]|jgi:RNA polymerase sigma-70 factor (ECF subfamily)|nr:sigma-70 family RNA polymerase sigma factor [Dongiaceae bacterium]